MKPARPMKPTAAVDSRVKAATRVWWLLLGGLPLAVWFGMQLGAAPQFTPVKEGGKLNVKTQVTAAPRSSDSAPDVTVFPQIISSSLASLSSPSGRMASDPSTVLDGPVAARVSRPVVSAAASFERPISSLKLRRSAPARLPLVFREVDPLAVGLSDEDVADIQELQSRFQAKIGHQNAHDPLYRQRWIQAQAAVDQELRARLGWPLFNAYQIQAARAQ